MPPADIIDTAAQVDDSMTRERLLAAGRATRTEAQLDGLMRSP
jgi:hypothetical protein